MQYFDGDELASPADERTNRLIPASLRRIASAAAFVALVAGMGSWAYRLGTRDAAEVPIVRAMEGPARIQPEDPGGFQAAHQGNEVNSVLEGAPAPVPREGAAALPMPAVLTEEDGPQGTLLRAAPAALVREALAGASEMEAPLPAEDLEFIEPAPDMLPDDAAAESEAEAAEAIASETAGAGMRPRGRPAGLRARAAASPNTAAAPATATASAPAEPPQASAPAVREVAGLSSGTRLVQLGAFDSEEITRKAWARLVASHGDLLGGKSLYVERTTGNARVFYRLRVAGFENTDQTRDMCEALRARGVDCIPVTLQ
jgi:cell division septation protein DedD